LKKPYRLSLENYAAFTGGQEGQSMKPLEQAIYKWVEGQAGKDLSILSEIRLLSPSAFPLHVVAIKASFPSTGWNERIRFLLCWNEAPDTWNVTTIPDLWLIRYVGVAIENYAASEEGQEG
jgi:hypothetical protein